MRSFLVATCAAITCIVSGQASAAEEWFFASPESMPDLVAQGYSIVGYSTMEEASTESHRAFISHRFVLQKDTSVYLCTQRRYYLEGESESVGCFRLREPW